MVKLRLEEKRDYQGVSVRWSAPPIVRSLWAPLQYPSCGFHFLQGGGAEGKGGKGLRKREEWVRVTEGWGMDHRTFPDLRALTQDSRWAGAPAAELAFFLLSHSSLRKYCNHPEYQKK